MENEIIKKMYILISNEIDKGNSVPLHSLLWTIDAQFHAIPSAAEINEAIRMKPGLSIIKNEIEILISATNKKSEPISPQDIKAALDIYKIQMDESIQKILKRNSKKNRKRA
jgi:hypothetical protein